MCCYLRPWNGDSVKVPGEPAMKKVLLDLEREAEHEHPDAALKHSNGWTLSCFIGGRPVWENVRANDPPRLLSNVTPERALEFWKKASTSGDLDEAFLLIQAGGQAGAAARAAGVGTDLTMLRLVLRPRPGRAPQVITAFPE